MGLADRPDRLRIPLGKQSTPAWGLLLWCMPVGWLVHRPEGLGGILVATLLGGGVLWGVLASPWMLRLYNRRQRWARLVSLVAGMAGYLVLQHALVAWLVELAGK